MPVTNNVGWDTETFLIAKYSIIPRKVCSSFDFAPVGSMEPGKSWVLTNGDEGMVRSLLTMWQKAYEGEYRIIVHNASFDVTVLMRYCLDIIAGEQSGDAEDAKALYSLIWEVLSKSMDNEFSGTGDVLVSDTLIRQKLYNLSYHGSLVAVHGKEVRYSLADLVWKYFKIDIKDKKVSTDESGRIYDSNGNDITGSPEAAAAWRLRFCELDGLPLEMWPQDAAKYAIDDALYARLVWESQESIRQPHYCGSINSESLQVYADIALRIAGSVGFNVDNKQVDRLDQFITAEMGRIEPVLTNNGILRTDGTVNTSILHERVANAWKEKGLPILYTDTGRVSSSSEVMDTLAGIDPVIDTYSARTGIAKLRSSYIENFRSEKTWSNYDILKETGRTSSFGSSARGNKKPLYPAINIQQMPRRAGVRECLLPPGGYVLASMDYSFLELCGVAQTTYSLFGESVHREKVNQGYDLHSYLGSSIASQLEPALVSDVLSDRDAMYALRDRDEAYHNFMSNRKAAQLVLDGDQSEDANRLREIEKRCNHFRKLSKPIGLGYPGGLGPSTCASMAKAVYGVSMTEQEASGFRDMWHGTYPEMRRFFSWVNEQGSPSVDQAYAYVTDGFNRFRNNATYCATSNGKAMQSLSADGAKRGVCYLARACAGGSKEGDIYRYLGDCQHMAFIHDENIVALPDDDFVTERAYLVSALMVEAMNVHMPDVLIGCEPAVMTRWSKSAELETVNHKGRGAIVARIMGTSDYGLLRKKIDPLGYDPDNVIIPWDEAHPAHAENDLYFGRER